MAKPKDETGNRYGRLIVTKEAGRDNHGNVLWKCKCRCGNIKTTSGRRLRLGSVKSCGCYRKEATAKAKTIHGHHGETIYYVWGNMKDRCLSKKNKSYKNYGGRGIKICKEWLEFLPFYEWAMSHGYQDNLTIERTDNSLGYSPDNCIFATQQEQSLNKRTYKNSKTGIAGINWKENIKKYAVRIGINNQRIHLGYFANIENAITARKEAELKYWNKT